MLGPVNIAVTERAALTDLLDQVGPDAPTLCEGWTTADLAAHLIVRENDPVAASGILFKPLAGRTERRMTEVLASQPWAEVVQTIRRGPAGFSLFRIPGVDEGANAVEFFVHHEDVRRGGEHPVAARDLDPEIEDFFFKRLKLMGKAMFRKVSVGLVLERDDLPEDAVAERSLRIRPGSESVTLIGKPSELLLFASGRGKQAEVTAVGSDSAIAELRRSSISM